MMINIHSDHVLIYKGKKQIKITFDQIRRMSNNELYNFLDDIRIDGYSDGYDDRADVDDEY